MLRRCRVGEGEGECGAETRTWVLGWLRKIRRSRLNLRLALGSPTRRSEKSLLLELSLPELLLELPELAAAASSLLSMLELGRLRLGIAGEF